MSTLAEESPPRTDSEVDLVKRLVPLIVATIDDRSWRVRWTAASKFADVICAFSELPDAMDALVPAYEKLLQDPEAEVGTTQMHMHMYMHTKRQPPYHGRFFVRISLFPFVRAEINVVSSVFGSLVLLSGVARWNFFFLFHFMFSILGANSGNLQLGSCCEMQCDCTTAIGRRRN